MRNVNNRLLLVRTGARVLTATAGVAGAAAALAQPITQDVFCYSGGPAPGTPEGTTFLSLTTPVIDNSGRVCVAGSLTGDGVDATNSRGVWAGRPGSLSLFVRAGEAAPGADPAMFIDPSTATRDACWSNGRVAVYGVLAGDGVASSNDTGFWTGDGTLGLLAREGTTAPGMAVGTNFGTLGYMAISRASAEVAVWSNMTGSGVSGGNDTAIWLGRGFSPVPMLPVVREGDPAPVAGESLDMGTLPSSFAVGPLGHVVFGAYANQRVSPFNSSFVVWRGRPGDLRPVLRQGDVMPDGDGETLLFMEAIPATDAAGRIAVGLRLSGATARRGVWRGPPGSLSAALPPGAALPGVGENEVVARVRAVQSTAAGWLLVNLELSDDGSQTVTGHGLWALDPLGTPHLVAREGQSMPGGSPLISLGPDLSASINNAGQVALRGDLLNSNQFIATTGIWVWDAQGGLRLVVRTNTNMTVAPGQVRAIGSVIAATGSAESGARSCLNDSGQLTYRVNFSIGGAAAVVAETRDTTADCDGNGLPDVQEMRDDASKDAFSRVAADVLGRHVAGGANGILDQCECVGDWDRNGAAEPADVAGFIATWLASVQGMADLNADVDADGAVQPADVARFIQWWFGAVTNPSGHGCG
ncbi:MAG: hypothetical protein KF745_09425 [Phycisphaeraceae bacterium]|nr:hypothetical protein [Phycisphaeraceae bacterium]